MTDQRTTIRETDILEALPFILVSIIRAQDTQDLYRVVYDTLEMSLGLKSMAVGIFHRQRDSMTFPFVSDEMGLNPGEIFNISRRKSLITRVIEAGTPLLFHEKEIQAISQGMTLPMAGAGCKAWAGIPLMSGGLLSGILIIQARGTEKEITEDHLTVLASVAGLISVFVEKNELQSALRQSKDMMQVMREITRAIHSSENLGHLFEKIHRALGRIINVSNFYIGIYNLETNMIRFPFFRDQYDDLSVWEDVSYLRTDSLTSEVFHKCQPLLLREEDLVERSEKKMIIGTVPKIWLGIPLMTKTEPIGVMVVQSYSDPDMFDETDMEILNAVSEQIAVAVERKRAEEEMKKSETKYRELFDSMPNGFYTSSPDGYFIDANRAFVKMLGYVSLDELKSVYIPGAIYFQESERDDILSQQMNEEFVEVQETYRMKRKDGEEVWVEDNARYIRDAEGNILYNQGVCRDITRRRKAEKALQESEARFRTLINHSYDAVLIHQPNGRIIDVNRTMLKMFNLTYEEALSYSISDYSGPGSDPETEKERWARVMEGEDMLFSWQARRPKDGSLFDAEIFLTRIVSGGRQLILNNIRDITEQKKAEKALRTSEEKHRLLFENAVEGIFQTTPEGKFLSVNPSFIKILGFESEKDLFSKVRDIGRQQYVDLAEREEFKSRIEAEGMIRDFETRLRKKDGTTIWVSLNARTVRDENGHSLYYEGFLQDITERKQAQEELYRVSIHDHLTGICNRRYVFERLKTMVLEFQREAQDFSLSIIDLDYFKKINDTHGHPAGDFILKEFARILREGFRPYDLVGRYGGEEFIVVAMNMELSIAHAAFLRLKEFVRSHAFDFNGTVIPVAFSAGLTSTAEPGIEVTVENLIQRADERLYRAKQQGRDRVVLD